jgi:ParB family chromosome partitioning protein
MAARKTGLGRGLDALIPVDRPDEGFATIPVDLIDANPQQPRQHFDDESLRSLADSIKEVGVLQPVVVRRTDEERYELVAGERRCRAARSAGLDEIPAIVRSETGAVSSLTEALIENVQREDLGPLEEAAAYRSLIDDFELTHDGVATAVGKSRSAVTNTLRLLQLPAPVQGMLERGEIAAGHARALLGVEDQAYAAHIARRCADEGWSVRQVEDAVRARAVTGPEKSRATAVRPAAIIELETRLAEHLGTRVKIDYGSRGGKVTVRFSSLDDLERIYRKFYG